MKIKTYIASIALLGLLASSCSSDDNEQILAGKDAIALSAMTLNADAVKASNLYLTAKLNEDPSKIYIGETQIDIPTLSATPSAIRFLVGKPTYPLSDKVINIFAYTGKASNGKMALKAGKGGEFDAILSNNGQRNFLPIDPANEGNGTLGSTTSPASLLQFRHVMTQIVVNIEIDLSETPNPVDPVPSSIKVGINDLVAQGSYSITAKEPVPGDEINAEKAIGTSGSYTLQLGDNYVIPNGANLKGQKLKSLVIDDYTATAADLDGFDIQALGGASDFFLLPGLSYNLTLTVSRLKVTAIKLSPRAWQVQEIKDTEITYEPYNLTLDLGSYQNTGEDQISKVVLYTSDNKTYVGETNATSDKVEFITMPATGKVNKATLYTKKGMLITSNITTEYESEALTRTADLLLPISAGGMIAENPGQPAGVNNPYLITTPLQFLNVEKDLTAHYKQATAIDMSALRIDEFKGFDEFTGVFDGNGYWFSNLYVTGAGIFKINSGTLKNMRIYTGTITAKGIDFAGGFAGTNNGTIVACTNEALIDYSNATAGGIVGKNAASGIILASVNMGRVTNGSVVGGIVGTNQNTNAGAISACVNIGALYYKAGKLGGIAGTSDASPSNSIINTSFWLIGSAERYIGSKETAVDSENIIRTNTSSRDTHELRNGISEGDTEEDRIVNQLNAEIAKSPQWKNSYKYVLAPLETGSTWPIPVIK